MQDELTKHTKKIYDTAKNSEKAFAEKVKDIIVEILIIVFAVTLSIWLHSWSEQNQQKKERTEFLSDLKEDLNSDIASMQSYEDSLLKSIANFQFIEQLTREKLDSLKKNKGAVGFYASIGTTKISDGNYEGFKSSGKLGFIENKTLKKHILKYYQETTSDLLEGEKFKAEQALKLTDYWNQNANQDFRKVFLSARFRAIVASFITTAKSISGAYKDAILQAKEIIIELDKQE